jgi:hypothetical protein
LATSRTQTEQTKAQAALDVAKARAQTAKEAKTDAEAAVALNEANYNTLKTNFGKLTD